jgi:Na+/H+ antiporter NhaD/arsenite permease-like protein
MAEETSFVMGAVVGFLAATFLGIVMQKIYVARGQMGAHRRPQSVSQQTSKTPAEVVRSSRLAALTWLFWVLVLIGIAASVIFGFSYFLSS